MNDKRLAKSYVWHVDQCYFISTIERDSSALLAPGSRYNETIVWKYDWDENERGESIWEHGHHGLQYHADCVLSFARTGRAPTDISDAYNASLERE